MPTMVLALNYWFHLIATVLWLGGLALLVFIAWPSLRTGDGPGADGSSRVLEAIERRFRPVANLSLVVLIVTGMIQMGGDPHYEGLLSVNNAWTVTLLVKHIVIIGMMIVAGVLQWGVYPALDRARLLAERRTAEGRALEAAEQQRLRRLAAVNVGLGTLVLLLTAYMTAL